MNQLKHKDYHWTKLQGNKFIKALHPSMLQSQGLLVVMKARVIGNSREGGEYVNVLFDKDYVLSWLIAKVIKPLVSTGFKDISNLLIEAWEKSEYSS